MFQWWGSPSGEIPNFPSQQRHDLNGITQKTPSICIIKLPTTHQTIRCFLIIDHWSLLSRVRGWMVAFLAVSQFLGFLICFSFVCCYLVYNCFKKVRSCINPGNDGPLSFFQICFIVFFVDFFLSFSSILLLL